ncbi:MAG TPA: hypothetical protein VGG99_18530 [Acetobacteraceae bacterium]|jgi:hypothetical protein
MAPAKPFNRQSLEQALRELGRRAYEEGKTVEIAIYGGSALILTYDWRIATRDVDAVFEGERQTVRRLAAAIAEENGWDHDWLNDGVKGFLSAADATPDAKRLFATYPSEDRPGLRVSVANPRYLFAMKCRAMRIGGVEETPDVADIRARAHEIGITSVQEGLDLVAEYYPANMLEVRFGLEEILGGGTLPSPSRHENE